MKHYILIDRQIREASLMEWARWYELTAKQDDGIGDRRVASTHVSNIWVSTVFLGIDHNFFGDGPPILFETMCFIDDEMADPSQMLRYCTWDEAHAGHERIVDSLRVLESESIRITEAMLGIVRAGARKPA
ncbi:hypothetical protein [Paraburkholderia sp. MM6662-R1]|uniref:hypothetical protein n=1 Tax=Paraburkholderia sp. MM6662-R1 TaxID=2991066 RepID=UPI003D1F709D